MSKAVFLDRDGVINEVLSQRVKFVNKPEQFHLLEGVGKGIKKLNNAGYKVFVVTNQGGIGLGFMEEAMIHKIHDKMKNDLKAYSAIIDDVIYCPHKPKGGCACRKPKPEMILRLAKKHNVELNRSFMIGDRDVDIRAGHKAGLKTILVGNESFDLANEHFNDLYEAANWIVGGEGLS